MQIAKYIFPLITLPFLARVLGPDSYSIRAYVVSFMVFMQTIMDYGFAQYGTKLAAENADDVDELSKINSNVFAAKALTIMVAGICAGVSSLFIPILADNALFVVVSFAATALKALLPDYILQGLEDMKAIALRFTVTQALALLAILMFIREPSQLIAIPSFEGLASLGALVWASVYLRHAHRVGIGRIVGNKLRSILSGSSSFFFALAASSVMSSTITVLMGVFPTDPILISCWSITATVIQGVQALWQPISRSLFPHMVKRHDRNLVKKLLAIGMPIVVALTGVCFFAAAPIMQIMGGDEYVQGATILRCIAPTLLFSYPIALLGYPVIGAYGRSASLSKCIAASGGFQLFFLLVAGFFDQFNIVTIAIARIGSEMMLCILELLVARSILKKDKSLSTARPDA